MTYQLYIRLGETHPDAAITPDGKASFLIVDHEPLAIQFKKDLANGAELKDATGNVMTSQAVTEFLQGLQ